ncbi:hypothetical protein M758_UG256700 [Ceratodon purpureus]|nr:hypothetical protein M758_UG256700 [Ceratodon purpureus]
MSSTVLIAVIVMSFNLSSVSATSCTCWYMSTIISRIRIPLSRSAGSDVLLAILSE